MKIFVTGGTGFLGSYLLRYLVKTQPEAEICALKRSTSSMDLVQGVMEQVTWLEGDVLDIISLAKAMEGTNKVYHCAAMVSYAAKDAAQMRQVNIDGTANVVNLALDLGVEKLLHVSSIAALGKGKTGKPLDESVDWEVDKRNTNYSVSKYESELEVWRGIAEGLNAVIINPSVILGAGSWDNGTGKFFKNAWNNFRFYPLGGTGFVDVRDVARIAIELMESSISNERFLVNGDNLSYEDLMTQISTALDKQPPSVAVTPFLREVAWRLAGIQAWLFNKQAFVTKETARQSTRRYYYNNQKSLDQLNFNYTPIQKTVVETAAQLQAAATTDFKTTVLPI